MALSEEKIIATIKQKVSDKNILGIGDDAAIIDNLIISKDLLIEDTHFRLDYFSAKDLAHKALHVNLSDIAAMGGRAKYLLLGLGIPQKISEAWLNQFLRHLQKVCQQNQITIIGGDTTRSTQNLFISITIIGQREKQFKLRCNSNAGDIICVSGNLGDATAGLIALENQIKNFTNLKNKLLKPIAKTNTGLFLAKQNAVHAMMDLSDGLYLDLAKFCHAAKVGAKIFVEQIPMSKSLIKFSQTILQQDPSQLAITGGEDYELLFSIDPKHLTQVQARYQKQFNKKLYPIGVITAEEKIHYLSHEKKFVIKQKPFSHFGEKS